MYKETNIGGLLLSEEDKGIYSLFFFWSSPDRVEAPS